MNRSQMKKNYKNWFDFSITAKTTSTHYHQWKNINMWDLELCKFINTFDDLVVVTILPSSGQESGQMSPSRGRKPYQF